MWLNENPNGAISLGVRRYAPYVPKPRINQPPRHVHNVAPLPNSCEVSGGAVSFEAASVRHRLPSVLLKALADLGIANHMQIASRTDAEFQELVRQVGCAHWDTLNAFRGEFCAFQFFRALLQTPRRLLAPQLHVVLEAPAPAAAFRRAGPPPIENRSEERPCRERVYY